MGGYPSSMFELAGSLRMIAMMDDGTFPLTKSRSIYQHDELQSGKICVT